MNTSMGFDEWCATFRPLKNQENTRPNPPFDGTLFEIYGRDREKITEALNLGRLANIWTLISGDDCSLTVVSGLHFDNRAGYFITEVPHLGRDMKVVYDNGEHPGYPAFAQRVGGRGALRSTFHAGAAV